MPIRRWPKIFTLGDRYTDDIFKGPVTITEKVDGSQINFGLCPKDGLTILSKGAVVRPGTEDKLFSPAAQYIESIQGDLPVGVTFHGETLRTPNHNTLEYARVPKNHIALYGITYQDGSQADQAYLEQTARVLGLDCVKAFYTGEVDPGNIMELLQGWLNQESMLGKAKIEGVVIKNYGREMFVGGQLLPLTQAKFVSEQFKELHKVAWPENNKAPITIIGEMVRTEARWAKAIQKLKDNGEFEQHPRDIGKALKYLHLDMEEEDKETIKEELWKAFSKDLKRAATRGFPEAYKFYLATGQWKLDITGKEHTDAR